MSFDNKVTAEPVSIRNFTLVSLIFPLILIPLSPGTAKTLRGLLSPWTDSWPPKSAPPSLTV